MNDDFENKSAVASTGFEVLIRQREALPHWSLLSKLADFGHNREAADIVSSFQRQIDAQRKWNQSSDRNMAA